MGQIINRRRMMGAKSGNPYDMYLVDLGLPSGNLWMDRNIGAENPENAGMYFSYGNIDGHYSGSDYVFNESNYQLSSGSDVRSMNIPSNATYDAAVATYGNGYKIPTNADWNELFSNTDQATVTINGVQCKKFMNKTDHDKYILFNSGSGWIHNNNTVSGIGASYYRTSTAYVYSLNLSQTRGSGTQDYPGMNIRAIKII